MKNYDAIVLGTGVAGLGAAVALARAGKKVLAIGKKGMRGEASPRAAGILDPLLEMNLRNPLLPVALESFRRYPDFLKELKRWTRKDVGYARVGMLYLAMNPAEEKELRRRFRWQRKSGMPVVWREREWILKKEPALSPKVRCGLFYPTVARVHPARLMAAFAAWAKKLGVTIKKYSDDAVLLTRKGAVSGVRVGKRIFKTAIVINATGSWSGANRRLKIRPPVVPARGQILIVKGPAAKISRIVHTLNGGYLVPWTSKGEYLLGSTVEFVGFKPNATRRGIRQIRKRVEALVPAVEGYKTVAAWAGLRPFSKDRLPLVGPTAVRGLYLNTGFFRSGILIGPHVGKLLGEGILSGRMPKILAPFHPKRFA